MRLTRASSRIQIAYYRFTTAYWTVCPKPLIAPKQWSSSFHICRAFHSPVTYHTCGSYGFWSTAHGTIGSFGPPAAVAAPSR